MTSPDPTSPTDPSPYANAVLLDHARHPRGRGAMSRATHRGRAENVLCGDTVDVSLVVEDDRVRAAAFEATGCAIVVAVASMLVERAEGWTVAGARERAAAVAAALVDGTVAFPEGFEALTDLRALATRHACALLPWKALGRAIAEPPAS